MFLTLEDPNAKVKGGQEFDVDLHEALMTVEDEAYSSDVVVQEHQKGYKLNGRVIRHAKVAVNK